MRVAIHQPEHLPWLGFFDRIMNVDAFVLLDHVNFRKNYFQNRNRIRNKNRGTWEWLTIPVEIGQNKAINKVEMVSRGKWQDKYIEKVRHNYVKSLYFIDIMEILIISLNQNSNRLADLNRSFISQVQTYLNIQTPIFQSSQMQVKGYKSSMLLEICEKIGGTEYVAGIGALDYLDKKAFREKGISIKIRNPITSLDEYFCDGQPLSVLDSLMTNGKNLRYKLDELKITEYEYN